MFKKIILDNFKSFRHVEMDLSGPKGVPLRYAFIYGENGSGKTNITEAFLFLKHSINTRGYVPTMDVLIGRPLGHEDLSKYEKDVGKPLPGYADAWERSLSSMKDDNGLLGPKDVRMIGSEGDMALEFHFSINGRDGVYAIAYNEDNIIVHEKLTYLIEERIGDIFDITASADGPAVRFSPYLFKNARYRQLIEDEIGQYWGRHSFMSVMNNQLHQSNREFLKEKTGTKIWDVVIFFNFFEVNSNVGSNRRTGIIGPKASLLNGMIKISEEGLLDKYEKALNSFFTRAYSDVKGVFYKKRGSASLIEYCLVFRKVIGGEMREIDASLESEGTKKLLELFSALLACALDRTVIYDEMDTGIHDKLICDIMADILPDMKGQFIVTTHNTCLLENLDPKNVFVIRVDRLGNKDISAFDRIEKTGKNNNNRNRYMNGVFDGIPIISSIGLGEIADGFGKERNDGEK